MRFNYARKAKTAQAMINGNGREVTLVLQSTTPTDPGAPHKGTTSTTLTKNITMLFTGGPLSKGALFTENEIRGKQHATVSAIDVPDINRYSFVNDASRVWKITETRTLEPGDTAILHELVMESIR